jgi:AraC-like DNA-binding protein
MHRTNKSIVKAEEGRGSVICMTIEKGLCAAYYDVLYLGGCNHTIVANDQLKSLPLFRLVFSFNGAGDVAKTPVIPLPYEINFYSSNSTVPGCLVKDKGKKSIELLFSEEWLTRNYNDTAGKVFQLIPVSANETPDPFFTKLATRPIYKIATGLAEAIEKKDSNLLHVKAKIFSLLDLFLEKTVERAETSLKINDDVSSGLINGIVEKLSKYYFQELPPIENLAKEYNISPSTLQRQFKAIFNKTIYQYYLEQKMALGLTMLEEKNVSVSEIAHRLGYQKINSFSNMFKKHYDILPSEVHKTETIII